MLKNKNKEINTVASIISERTIAEISRLYFSLMMAAVTNESIT